ncbi:MAG: hypothetical protein ABIQ87_03545, partial [Rubrivivax sp.]
MALRSETPRGLGAPTKFWLRLSLLLHPGPLMTLQLQPSSKRTTLVRQLGLCALGLAGTFAAVADASAVVINRVASISVPNDTDGIYLNLVTGVSNSNAGLVPGYDINPYSTGTSLAFYFGGTGAPNFGVGSPAYTDLTVGSVVSAASVFQQSAQTVASTAFQSAGNHILGLSFLNEATGVTNYGYLRLNVSGTAGFPVTITGWSYENMGAAITVAVVPEP